MINWDPSRTNRHLHYENFEPSIRKLKARAVRLKRGNQDLVASSGGRQTVDDRLAARIGEASVEGDVVRVACWDLL